MGFRLDNKKRSNEEIGGTFPRGFNQVFDNQMMAAFRLTDQEYDFIAEFSTNEEMEILFTGSEFSSPFGNQEHPSIVTYAEKKMIVKTLDSLMKRYSLQKG